MSFPLAGIGRLRTVPLNITRRPLSTRRRLTCNVLTAGTMRRTVLWAGSVSAEPAYANRSVRLVLPAAV